ncbi:MAG: hypothetical protein JW891_05375 [Candidatus Lokiarchaeota archaeon]|nr:hypothetical protein [Candidatus Lokiarchaeota archaeon]
MSKEAANNAQLSQTYKELQGKIEDYREKRDDLNKKTKEYITQLQELENQIAENLKVAKDEYKKKRDFWNNKVKKLKDKKIEYKGILDNFIEERKTLQKKGPDGKEQGKYGDLKQITRKIENLERMIETENLEINEENAIIDQIKELAEVKQDLLESQNSDELVKLDRKIEIVKLNLNKIYEQLSKWSNKSQDNHAKMLEIYDVIGDLKEKKKKMEEELIKNKQAADMYHEQFLELMNQRKKISKNYRPSRTTSKSERRPRKIRFKDTKVKEAEMLEQLKKEKLADALEKKKAGKKLNLYEARLILEAQNQDN